jgi:hypothetical protein
MRASATAAHRFAENLRPAVRYIGGMNSPASVMGCSSCGALYPPTPGDRGVCEDCRRLLPADPQWRSGGASPGAQKPAGSPPRPAAGPSPRPASGQAIASIAKRPASSFSAQRPSFRRSNALRRLAIGASCAAAVAGGGGWVITHERSLSDVERAIRHRSPSEAWTAIKRHAAAGWAALEARLPFDLGKRSGSAAAPSRPAVRDSTGSHGTQHRAKKTGKRGRDDPSGFGNSP